MQNISVAVLVAFAVSLPLMIFIGIRDGFTAVLLFYVGLGCLAVIMLISQIQKEKRNKKLWNEIKQSIDWMEEDCY